MTQRERAALAGEIAAAVQSGEAPHSCSCGSGGGPPVVPEAPWNGLAGRLDLCLTGPGTARPEVEEFLAAARSARVRSACVPPRWLALAVRALQDRPTKVASLVGYPSGTSLTPAKCSEAECLLRMGADELWMVADIGGLRSGDLDSAYIDIKAVADVAACRAVPVNVVLELPLLRGRQRVEACVVAKLAGAAAVVSATGCGGSLADASHVELMRRTVGGDLDIVAAGGIRTAAAANRMLAAGATRVGASHQAARRAPSEAGRAPTTVIS